MIKVYDSIIDRLNEKNKNRYCMLSNGDKERIISKAEKLAKKLEYQKYAKSADLKKRAKALWENQRTRGSLHNHSQPINLSKNASELKDNYLLALSFLLEYSESANDIDSESDDEVFNNFQRYIGTGTSTTGNIRNIFLVSRNAKRVRRENHFSNASKSNIAKAMLKRDVRVKAARASKAGGTFSMNAGSSSEAVKSFAEKTKEATKQLIKVMRKMANPVMLIIGLVIVVFSAVFVSLAAVIGASSGVATEGANDSYEAKVSAKTEAYRPLVEKYCDKYGIDDYVELVLAMIEQESGGNPPDVMQTEQSYYNTHPPIDSPEESIDCGTHELSDCLKSAKCKDPDDIAGIKLAIQGYNFGNGYIAWAIKNYKGYTEESAKVFSAKMKAQLHLSGYGDVDYVKHVLRYYVAIENATISNEQASKILKEIKENNKASTGAWKVIEKGASLIGKVDYSMEKRQGDGRDNPKYLDCSSFTAWAFHKSGYSGIPYGSTTATFVESGKFETISADKLKVGDIGLKSSTTATGGSNHVGIYCGKLKNGTKVWLHCTSSSSTSLTGNNQGVMFGAYTNFTYFRHFKKFN